MVFRVQSVQILLASGNNGWFISNLNTSLPLLAPGSYLDDDYCMSKELFGFLCRCFSWVFASLSVRTKTGWEHAELSVEREFGEGLGGRCLDTNPVEDIRVSSHALLAEPGTPDELDTRMEQPPATGRFLISSPDSAVAFTADIRIIARLAH